MSESGSQPLERGFRSGGATDVPVLPDVLRGEWTPHRVLYLARAEEIDALCELLNSLSSLAGSS